MPRLEWRRGRKRVGMDWWTAVALGAGGGLLVEIIALYTGISVWQQKRHRGRLQRGAELPPLTMFVDPAADLAVGLTRLVLGAAAGLMFHTDVTGIAAAVAVGASAPAVLQQLGNARAIREAVQGESDVVVLEPSISSSIYPVGETEAS